MNYRIIFGLALLHWTMASMFEIEEIKIASGLFYEKQGSILLKRTEWQIIIHFDIGKLFTHPNTTVDHTDHLLECYPKTKDWDACWVAFDREIIDYKNQTLHKIQEQIKEKLTTLTYTVGNEGTVPVTLRKKRMAPLGIVGQISQGIFGTATMDDINLINKNIDQLYSDQKDVIRLGNEKTHIVTNMYKKVIETTKKHEKQLNYLATALRKETRGYNDLENKFLHLTKLNNYARKLELMLDHLIESNKNFLDILRLLHKGQAHPDLLGKEILTKIISDLQIMKDVRLPVPIEHLRTEEFYKICSIEAIHQDNLTAILLRVPLITTNDFNLYQIHSLPSPQNYTEKPLQSAYIEPSHNYIALSTDNTRYFKLTNEQLQICKQVHYGYICTLDSPISLTSITTDCELNMLIRPSITVFKYCKILLKYSNAAHWSYLRTDGLWLYATTKPEVVRIRCSNTGINTTTVEGVGLLRMAPNCMGETNNKILLGTDYRKNPEIYVYRPEVHLDIGQIYPEIVSGKLKETFSEIRENAEISILEEPIERVIKNLNQISNHKRILNQHGYILATGISFFSILIMVCFLLFYKWLRYQFNKAKIAGKLMTDTITFVKGKEILTQPANRSIKRKYYSEGNINKSTANLTKPSLSLPTISEKDSISSLPIQRAEID